MKTKKNLYSPVITTGVLTLDHFNLIEPVLKYGAKEGDARFYNAQAYAPANSPKAPFAKIIEAGKELCKEWGVSYDKLETTGVRTGEDKIEKSEKPENAEYLRGMLFLNAKKVEKNGAPKLFRFDQETKSQVLLKDPQEIEEYFYRGAKVSLSVTIGTYELAGKKGLTLYLNNAMFVAHGTRVGGATGSEFSGVEFDFEVDEDSAV